MLYNILIFFIKMITLMKNHIIWSSCFSFLTYFLLSSLPSPFCFLGSNSHSCIKLFYMVETSAYMSSVLAGPISSVYSLLLITLSLRGKKAISDPINGASLKFRIPVTFFNVMGHSYGNFAGEKLLASFCWKLD